MKILFVDSTVIGEDSPTGATLENITKGIKDCEFMQYCIDYAPEFHTPCYKTIYEDKSSNPEFYFIKSLYRKKYAKQTYTGGYKTSLSTNGSTFGLTAKFILDMVPHRIGKRNLAEILKFKPDIIYSLGGTITSLKITYKLSVLLNIPIVLHVMDDWFSTKYMDCRLTRIGNKSINVLAEKVLSRSVVNLGISKKMAEHYKAKFNKEFSYAMNTIEGLHEYPLPDNKKLRFVFSGGIHGGRDKSLQALGNVIHNDRSLADNISFEIFTSPKCINRFGSILSNVAKIYEYVPTDRMFDNLGNADVLVHVESFKQEDIDYFRYSLSTKIPEYLSVGRPILCYGSIDIGSVSYIEETGVGMVASDEIELNNVLHKLVCDNSLRIVLGKRALQVAQQEHTNEFVSQKVYETFVRSISIFQNSMVKKNEG